ncbi:magnesium chelatase subunit H [Candidatus Pacearchaeota archaeon]|nr:MAG: magnesium chelatase subunit H [Candidatus Pacearchaeota archaeon]
MPFLMTFVSISDAGLRLLSEVIDDFISKEEFGPLFERKIKIDAYFVGEQRDYSEKISAIRKSILSSDIVLLDLMGAERSIYQAVEESIKRYEKDLVLIGYAGEYLRSREKLGSFSMQKLTKIMEKIVNKKSRTTFDFDMKKMLKRMEALGKLIPFGFLKDMRNWIYLKNYWRNASIENIKNMLFLLCRDYGKIKELPKPKKPIDFSKYVLFDPENMRGFESFSELKKEWGWNENQRTIGLLFHNFNYPNYSFGIISKIIKLLRKKYNVVPFGISLGSDKYEKINKVLNEGLKLDLIWDFLPFRFGIGPMGGDVEASLNIFRKMNVPIMHPFFLRKRKIRDWEESLKGLSPMEVIIHIMLPELDGVVDAVPVAGLEESQNNRISDLQELKVIEGRLKKLIARSESWINLRAKADKDKRVAFILYNYPPGEENVGSASFLDTFKSIERIISKMREAGYCCGEISASELEKIFMYNGVCNSANWSEPEAIKIRYPVEKYITGDTLHQIMIEQVSKEWGEPPGNIMVNNNSFLIPGVISGNIFIGLQPSRGSFEDPSKLYHDKDLPPHHQYMAFYRWLEEEFKADVVIHVGTHGTLELLPGKEAGLSDKCFPDYLIGKMVHLYIYYIGNPSEAIVAKRRTYGCLISYSSPPFKRSGSYGDLVELEDMINEYIEAERLHPQKQVDLLKKIKEKVSKMKLIIEGELTVDNISKELIRLKNSLIPLGLHEFGKPFEKEEEICFLSAVLCWNRGKIRSLKEIIEDELDNIKSLSLSENKIALDNQINHLIDKLVKDYFFGEKKLYNEIYNQLSSSGKKKLEATMKYGEKCLERLRKSDEIKGLLNALEGNYIEARLGGDIIRDPEILPTGYNIYQFDPRIVPSEVAMERGNEIAKNTINYYLKKYKKYPETVGLVLWGFETAKTHGETIGQILSYLGVRIKREYDIWEPKFEIIPLSELKRPRIDCVITICGFFRDMFPNLIDLLDEIFEAVASLDEPLEMNFVKKHSLSIYNEMVKETSESRAKELSTARIFGPAEGQYGTGITTMIESANWKEEVEIANAFISARKHVYTRNRRGEAQKNLFEHNLRNIDLVSQVQSSADYSFSDLDHYYEYFGGLAKSVETAKGKKLLMLFTDSSTSTIYTDEAKKAIEVSVRTRLLNPVYIEEMLKHKVHGAQQIAKRIENLIGLAATTGRVDSWIFDEIKKTYLDNPEIFSKLKENNLFATTEIIKKLFEAEKRGYWKAREEDMKDLAEKYLELEGNIEEIADKTK